jgi:3-oxoacyl-[acyl-carrier protein] reductase
MEPKLILARKTCLVTGAGRGIGKAIALALARRGANVALCSRTLAEVERVGVEIEKIRAGSSMTFRADISDLNTVSDMVSKVLERFGSLDVLVNNAGVQGPIGQIWKNDLQEWKRTVEINLFGTVNCCISVVPAMIEARNGKIIIISGSGEGAFPRFSAYSCSKSALVRLTENLAAELREFNIQVNALAPGAVNTRFLEQVIEAGSEAGQYLQRAIALRKSGGGSAEKAADLACFLASDASNGLTGRLLSATWDDWHQLDIGKIDGSSLYQMRRIDGVRYIQSKENDNT